MTSCGDQDGVQVLAPEAVALVAGGPIIGKFVKEEKGVGLWFLPYYAEAQRTVVTCLTLRMKLKPLGLIFKALVDLVPKPCLTTSAPRFTLKRSWKTSALSRHHALPRQTAFMQTIPLLGEQFLFNAQMSA